MIDINTIKPGDCMLKCMKKHDEEIIGRLCFVEDPDAGCHEYVLSKHSIYMKTFQEIRESHIEGFHRVPAGHFKVVARLFEDTFFKALQIVEQAINREILSPFAGEKMTLYSLPSGGYLVAVHTGTTCHFTEVSNYRLAIADGVLPDWKFAGAEKIQIFDPLACIWRLRDLYWKRSKLLMRHLFVMNNPEMYKNWPKIMYNRGWDSEFRSWVCEFYGIK